jgi:hypothetical protein
VQPNIPSTRRNLPELKGGVDLQPQPRLAHTPNFCILAPHPFLGFNGDSILHTYQTLIPPHRKTSIQLYQASIHQANHGVKRSRQNRLANHPAGWCRQACSQDERSAVRTLLLLSFPLPCVVLCAVLGLFFGQNRNRNSSAPF